MNISDIFTEVMNVTSKDMGNGSIRRPELSEPNLNIKIGILESFAQSFGLVLACTGLLFNFYALQATVMVESAKLKSKWFIFNMLMADCLLPVFSSFNILLYVVYAFGITSKYVHTCIFVVITTLNPLGLYYQSLASFVLAIDRLYAIFAPLKYYTTGYPRWLLFGIIVSTWVIPIVLVLPAFVIPFSRPVAPAYRTCYMLRTGYVTWTGLFRTYFVAFLGLITFGIYITLFALVKWVRSSNVAVSGNRSKSRKDSLSLAITYFTVHCATLLLLLPAPIFTLLVSLRLKSFRVAIHTQLTIRRVLILLYMLNPIIDPLILSLRIPAIKERLNVLLDFGKTSQHPSSEEKSIGNQTQQESLAMP